MEQLPPRGCRRGDTPGTARRNGFEPDAVFERATAAGATVVQGLRDEDYGSRGFTVRDPEGVFWSFGTYGGAAS